MSIVLANEQNNLHKVIFKQYKKNEIIKRYLEHLHLVCHSCGTVCLKMSQTCHSRTPFCHSRESGNPDVYIYQ